ncbi:SAV_2336 N-terminal domain-related protein [Streptomyces sp. NPDC050704]|uniref:SAV_2336 N-terminal domain-related protein n=1 Tax=Streptomyces sp. NPDC050704 TaxID=3157219 RepID=UPI0034186AB6
MSSATRAQDELLVDRLRRALAAAGHDLTAGELSDLLWLALHTPLPGASGTAEETVAAARPERPDLVGAPAGPVVESAQVMTSPRSAPPDREDAAATVDSPVPSPHPSRRQVYALTGVRPGTGAAPVRIPGVRGLSHQLGVARGLRPLKRTVPSPYAVELDEAATAEAIADSDVLDLVVRPARERWLDLLVVVDDGLSMRVWADTVVELARLLGSSGIFRKVSVRDHSFATPLPRARFSFSERTVVLAFSDATARCWRDGTALRHLARWSRVSPTAVINPLPARLWSGTGLDAEFTTVRAHRSAPANTALHTPYASLPVPVLELAEWDLGPWARLIASEGATARLAVVDAAAPAEPPSGPGEPDGRDPEERLRDFQSTVSCEAYELAGHLAAVDPLTLPVMRVVQAAVLPGSGPACLSEVLLGGLMSVGRPLDGTGGRRAYDVFAFDPDVRELLELTVRSSSARRTVDAVSDFIGARIGRSVDFPALIGDRTGTLQLPEQGAPFGELMGAEETEEAEGDAAQDPLVSAVGGLVRVYRHVGDLMFASYGFLVGPDLVLTAGAPLEAQVVGAASTRPLRARVAWWQDTPQGDNHPGLVLLRTDRRLEPGRTVEPARTPEDWPVLPGTLHLGLWEWDAEMTAYRCWTPEHVAVGSAMSMIVLDGQHVPTNAVGAPVLAPVTGKLLGVVAGVSKQPAALVVRALHSLTAPSLSLLDGEDEGSYLDPGEVEPLDGLNNLGVPGTSGDAPHDQQALAWLDSAVRAAPREGPYVLAGPRGTFKTKTVFRYVHGVAHQYRLLWWVDCSSVSHMVQALAELTDGLLLEVRGRATWTAEGKARWAVSWLDAHEGWLLVLDHVEASSDLSLYGLDTLRTGTVLVTTRKVAREHWSSTYVMSPDRAELARVCAEIREQNRHAYELLGVVAWYGPVVRVDLLRGLWPDAHARQVVQDAITLLTARGVVQEFEDGSFLTSPVLRMMMRTPAPPKWTEEDITAARSAAVRVLFDQIPEAHQALTGAVEVSRLARLLDPYASHIKALADAAPPAQDTVEMAILFFGVGLRQIWRDASPDGVRLGERACDTLDAYGGARNEERAVLVENALSSVPTVLSLSSRTVEAAGQDGVPDLVNLIRERDYRTAARMSDRLLGPEHPLSASLKQTMRRTPGGADR